MKKEILLALLLMAVPLFAGDNDIPVPGKEVKVTTRQGREFKLTLPANPTTGYDWELLPGHDEKVVSFSERKVLHSKQSRRLAGAPVREEWHFTANNAGTTNVRLVYKRNWETEVVSTMTYTVTVR